VSDNHTREAMEELLDYLEQVETQSGAVLELLRDAGIATDEKLAPYLERSSNATDVKSRAIRARFDFLFTEDEAKPATEGVPANSALEENPTATTAQQSGEQEKAA